MQISHFLATSDDQSLHLRVAQVGCLILIGIVTHSVWRAFYNLYLHPLAKFPGPRLAAVSEIWFARAWTGGLLAHKLQDAHNKYGDVIRIAPNDLEFVTPKAFQDIHGHASKGQPVFAKAEMYDSFDPVPAFATMRDPKEHAEGRRKLAHAFSASALSKQSEYVMRYIDLFMKQVENFGQIDEGIDIGTWLNWLSFDIIGDLAFGDSFGSVENAQPNPVVTRILNIFYAGSLGEVFRRIPLLKLVAPFMGSVRQLLKDHHDHLEFALERVRARVARGNDRNDFFGHVLANKERPPNEMWLRSEAEILLAAGTDTTAGTMTSIIYNLLQVPATLDILKNEIRSAFSDHSEINETSTMNLQYLNAVIEESLRITPPLPINLPRISPGAFVDGTFVPKGVTVTTHQFTTHHHPDYFGDPDEFHPERFLPKSHTHYNQKYLGDNLEASKPFLAGRHTCIGRNLAYLELRIIISKLVFLFEWEAIDSLGPGRDVDWLRDLRARFIWVKPCFRVKFTPSK